MRFELASIEDVCNQICSGGTPKSTEDKYYDRGNIPWLNTKEIDFNRIRVTERKITKLGFDNSSVKWVYPPAIVVAMYGATAGNIATIHIPLTTNQACCNLIINDDKADYRFVYYSLMWKNKDLAGLANGGAQQNLNAKLIKEFPIELPDIKTQKTIADILWEIDDKIETNTAINKNLEEQAQAIYKSWFVDFEPFGGEMPTDWRNYKLLEFLPVITGKKNANVSSDKGIYPFLAVLKTSHGRMSIPLRVMLYL